MIDRIKGLAKAEPVLTVSWVLAALSALWVRPDKEYAGYIDADTLFLLFGLMAAMAGFQSLGLFRKMGAELLSRVRSSRGIEMVMVFLCFFSSMFITNDVALITFVPFAIITLKLAGLDEMIVPVAVLQTVAANMGSMLTPMGNPQNIYLYFKSGMAAWEFVRLTGPYVCLAMALLWGCCMLGKKRDVVYEHKDEGEFRLNIRLGMYIGIFILCLCALGKILPAALAAAAAAAAVMAADRQVLKRIDYGLLLTFIGFFIFVGNMGRIPAFSQALEGILAGHEMAVAAGASQIISNVPAVLLLTGFTHNWKALIIGSNLGGLGTLIASMANLISYKWVCKEAAHFRHAYVRLFTICCVFFLLMECMLYFCINFV